MSPPEPSESDLARWAKWDELRADQDAAQLAYEQHVAAETERFGSHADTACPHRSRALCSYALTILSLKQREEELRQEGIEEMLAEDMARPEQQWWLSFVDPGKPEGKRFLGVAIVRGGGMQEAIQNAWAIGINPGGEVQAVPIPDEHAYDKYLNRLMAAEELKREGLA